MTTPRYSYIRDPAEIYAESFRQIETTADLSAIPETMRPLAIRLIHAGGRPEVVSSLHWSDGAVEAGMVALKAGAPILCDVEMVSRGVIRDRLPASNAVMCTLGFPGVRATATRFKTTRSAAAVENWRPWLEGSVIAIGNAPTALFHLLERLHEGWEKPALILGFPVGFVGAAESKDALAQDAATLGVPFIAMTGREGGSAYAAAAVNALAKGNDQ